MTNNNVRSIPLSLIKVTFYVRREALNHDEVIEIAELYEGGANLPPITVSELPDGSYEVVDGRTRMAGLDLLGKTHVDAIVMKFPTRNAMIAEAFKLNCGGAKRPIRGDWVFFIQNMLNQGVGRKAIHEMLDSHCPPSVLARYIELASDNILQRKLARALDLMAQNNLSPLNAARYIEPDDEKKRAELEERIKRRLSKDKHTKLSLTAKVEQIKGGITQKYRSVTQFNGKTLGDIMRGIESGEMTEAQAQSVLLHFDKTLVKLRKSFADWQSRFSKAFIYERAHMPEEPAFEVTQTEHGLVFAKTNKEAHKPS